MPYAALSLQAGYPVLRMAGRVRRAEGALFAAALAGGVIGLIYAGLTRDLVLLFGQLFAVAVYFALKRTA
jgi:hypothetical protein